MVDYLGIEGIRALIARHGIGGFIAELAREIEDDYARWPVFAKSTRHATHCARGVIELMPISDGRLYACKYVNGHPGNTERGLLTVAAFGMLCEVETGYPLLIADLTLMTALRTAAMSALAARRMARPDSRVMAVIGNGAQSDFQCMAFHELAGIDEVRLYDRDRAATLKVERNLGSLGLTELRVVCCDSVAHAVEGADIVTTLTADKRRAVILTPELVRPGMHLNAVGGDCPGKTELHPGIFGLRGVRVVVEFEPQARVEGEIQQLSPSFPVTEFADIVSGAVAARLARDEITIFDSVGFALEDFSALRFLHEQQRARESRRLDLVPELANPKDLVPLLGPAATLRPARRPALQLAKEERTRAA